MDREALPPPILTVSLPDASELEQLQRGDALDDLELGSPGVGTSPILTAHVFPPDYKKLLVKATEIVVQIKAILIENGRDRSYVDEVAHAYDAAELIDNPQLSASATERDKRAFERFVRDVLQPVFRLTPPGIKALVQEDVAAVVEYATDSATHFRLPGTLRVDTASFNHYDISAEEAELGKSNHDSPTDSVSRSGLAISAPLSPNPRRIPQSPRSATTRPSLSFTPAQLEQLSLDSATESHELIAVDYVDLRQKVLHIVDWIRSTLIGRGLTDDCQDIDEITTLYWATDDDLETPDSAVSMANWEREVFKKTLRELLQPIFRTVPPDVKDAVLGDVVALHLLGDVDQSALYSEESDHSLETRDMLAESNVRHHHSLSTVYTVPDMGQPEQASWGSTVRKVPSPPPVPALPSWYHASNSKIPTVDPTEDTLRTRAEALSYIYGNGSTTYDMDNSNIDNRPPTSLAYPYIPITRKRHSLRETTAFDQLGPVIGQETVERRRHVHKPSQGSLASSTAAPVTESFGVGLDPNARFLMDQIYSGELGTCSTRAPGKHREHLAEQLVSVLHRAPAGYVAQGDSERTVVQDDYVIVYAMQIKRGELKGWCLVEPLQNSRPDFRRGKGWVPGAYLEKLGDAEVKAVLERNDASGEPDAVISDFLNAFGLGQPEIPEYVSTLEVVMGLGHWPGTPRYDTYVEENFGTYDPVLPSSGAYGPRISYSGYSRPSVGYQDSSGVSPMPQAQSVTTGRPEVASYDYAYQSSSQPFQPSLYTPTPGPSYSGYPQTTYSTTYEAYPQQENQYNYTPLFPDGVPPTAFGVAFGPGKILSELSFGNWRPAALGWFTQKIAVFRGGRKQRSLLPIYVEAVELDASDGSDPLSNMLSSCTLPATASEEILRSLFGNRLCSVRYRGIGGVYISALSRGLFDAIQSAHIPVSSHHHGELFVAILLYIAERLHPTTTMWELARSKSFISVYRQLPEPMELADTTFRPRTPVKRSSSKSKNSDDSAQPWRAPANVDGEVDRDASPSLTEQKQAYDWLRFAIDSLFLIDLRSPEMLYEDESNGDKPIEELCSSFLPAGAGFHIAPTIITSIELTASMLCEWRGIQFQWTNNLADHLEHNSELGTVKIYSEVAPCFLHDIAKSDSSLCKTGLIQHRRTMVEIAHTYRLLFGADARSYTCFTQLDVDNRSRTYFDFRTLPLCDRQPRTQYNVSTDFPVYGERIIALNTLLKPTGLKILWKDKRNSLQWYTFWAVVFIGGLGILMAFTQIALGAVQAWASMQALKGSGGS